MTWSLAFFSLRPFLSLLKAAGPTESDPLPRPLQGHHMTGASPTTGAISPGAAACLAGRWLWKDAELVVAVCFFFLLPLFLVLVFFACFFFLLIFFCCSWCFFRGSTGFWSALLCGNKKQDDRKGVTSRSQTGCWAGHNNQVLKTGYGWKGEAFQKKPQNQKKHVI